MSGETPDPRDNAPAAGRSRRTSTAGTKSNDEGGGSRSRRASTAGTRSNDEGGGSRRGWWVAAAALVVVAVAGRIHNAFAYPPLRDFDGAGHALNAFAIFRGELPDPRSWSGFHPPLSYLVGGGLWRLLPEAMPVHVTLRLASAVAGFVALVLVFRALRRETSRTNAAVVCAVAICAPVFAIATSMMGNETLCALLVTACLVRLMSVPPAPERPVRHALGTGLLAGLAILSKSTGVIALAAAVVTYASVLHRDRRTLSAVLVVLVTSAALLSAPHYLRLMHVAGTGPVGAISGGIGSPDARAAMQVQPPGERHLEDYWSFPSSSLLSPFYLEPRLLRSVPGLLYASTWADAHAQFLPPGADPRVLSAESVTAIGGLLPTAIGAAGIVAWLRRPGRRRTWLGPGCFGGLMLLAFAAQAWTVPHYSAVKASYLLPALLPACLALVAGLELLGTRVRSVARAGLLLLAAACAALTWYGWWS